VEIVDITCLIGKIGANCRTNLSLTVSVGGGDYGSVRVGTYMGRKMIKCAASDLVSESLTSGPPVQSDCYKENGMGVLKSEAALEYLCNLPPHRSHLVNSTFIFMVLVLHGS
jgi:hypothetical protein